MEECENRPIVDLPESDTQNYLDRLADREGLSPAERRLLGQDLENIGFNLS